MSVPFRITPFWDLDNPGIFSEFFPAALEFAFSPHMEGHSHFVAMGNELRSDDWKWIANQAMSYLPGQDREHADLVGNVPRKPRYVLPRIARDSFDLWNIVRLRRMELDNWELAPFLSLRHTGSPTLRFLL